MSVLARLQNLEHKVEGRLPPRLAEEPEPKLEIAAETYHCSDRWRQEVHRKLERSYLRQPGG